jgi:hypothetical protein
MLIALLAVAACQQQVHVAGTTSDQENIKATATGVPGMSGRVVLEGDRGLRCTGEWSHVAFGVGLGTLSCADGKTGTFFYTQDGKGGGRIDNRDFGFSFTPIYQAPK